MTSRVTPGNQNTMIQHTMITDHGLVARHDEDVSSNYSQSLQKAYLEYLSDPLALANLKGPNHDSSYYEMTKLPSGKIEDKGSYKWKYPTIYLPTPSLTTSHVKTMLIDRTPQEETRLQGVASAFQAVGNQTNKLNKTVKNATNRIAGVYEVLKQFDDYRKGLSQAFETSGFRRRKEYFARLQLLVNLFKRFNEEDFLPIRNKGEGQNGTLTYFFERQAWEPTSGRLLDSTLNFQDPNVNAGHVISLKNSVQSGDKEDPSVIIPFSRLIEKPNDAAFVQLRNWFNEGGVDFYMIKFICDVDEKFLPVSVLDALGESLKTLIKGISKNTADLLAFVDTRKIPNQRYASSPKLTDIFFTATMVEDNLCSELRKLDISGNYISSKSFGLLANMLRKAQHLRDLKISGLRLGEAPEVTVEDIHPKDDGMPPGCCSCFGKCFNACFGMCCYRIGLPSTPQIDYSSLDERVKEVVAVQDKSVREFLNSANEILVPLISVFEEKEGIGNNLHTLIAADFPFYTFTKDAIMIERFCTAVAKCNPFAVSFEDSHLTDKNQLAIAALFYENPSLLHLNLRGTMLYSLESWSHLQKLIQSSPIIVSMPLSDTMEITKPYTYVSQPYHDIKKESMKAGCCKSIDQHHYTLLQTVEKRQFLFGPAADDLTSIDVIRQAIKSETVEHRLMPYHKVFKQMFASDPKKLKVLEDFINENKFDDVFSRVIEDEKERAFTNFKNGIKAQAAEFSMDYDENASIILDYDQLWRILD